MSDFSERAWRPVVDLNDEYFPGWKNADPVELYAKASDLQGEAGEIANAFKHYAGRGTNVTQDRSEYLVQGMVEMVDLWHYFVLLWESAGGSAEDFLDVLQRKVGTNRRRMEARSRGEDP